jgi:DnaJ-class molecular chaperone
MESKELELERECKNCHGEGVADGELCVVCKGDRRVLTEFGERVADLIDRRISVRLHRL